MMPRHKPLVAQVDAWCWPTSGRSQALLAHREAARQPVCLLQSPALEKAGPSESTVRGSGKDHADEINSIPLFFPTTLLRYNSHTIQVIHFKYTIQSRAQHKLETISVTPKRNLVSVPPQPSRPWATTKPFSAVIDLPIRDISHKWNYTQHGHLCLFLN